MFLGEDIVTLESTSTLRSVLRCIVLTLTLLTIVARAQSGPDRLACTGVAFQSRMTEANRRQSSRAFHSAKHFTNLTPMRKLL